MATPGARRPESTPALDLGERLRADMAIRMFYSAKIAVLRFLRSRGLYHGPIHYRMHAKPGRFGLTLMSLTGPEG